MLSVMCVGAAGGAATRPAPGETANGAASSPLRMETLADLGQLDRSRDPPSAGRRARAKETNWRVLPSAFSRPGGNRSSTENSVTNSSSRRRSRLVYGAQETVGLLIRGAGMGRM